MAFDDFEKEYEKCETVYAILRMVTILNIYNCDEYERTLESPDARMNVTYHNMWH